MPEYHAIITVQANNWFDAERAFDAAIADDDRLSLVRLASVPPDTSGEPHPRLERPHPRYGRGVAPLTDDYRGPAPDGRDECNCGGSGAIDGHNILCNLRRVV